MKLRTAVVLALTASSSWCGLALAAPPATAATTAPAAVTASATGTQVTRYKGQTVTIDPATRVLTITRGKHVTSVTVPAAGSYLFTTANGGVVHVWQSSPGGFTDWTYNLDTKKQATITHTGVFSWYGPAGFWAKETAADGTVTDVMYNWKGQELYRQPDALRANISWFTKTAGFVRVNGTNPTGVAVVPVNGDPVKVWELGLPVTSVGFPTNDAAQVTYLDASGVAQTCTLTETGSTCPGGWA